MAKYYPKKDLTGAPSPAQVNAYFQNRLNELGLQASIAGNKLLTYEQAEQAILQIETTVNTLRDEYQGKVKPSSYYIN